MNLNVNMIFQLSAYKSIFRHVNKFSHIFTYAFFSFATLVISFVAVMVVARLLPPSEYGKIGYFFSILYFTVPIISLSADGLIAVNKVSQNEKDYDVFQRSYILLAYLIFFVLQIAAVVAWLQGILTDPLFMFVPLFGLVRFLANMAATEYVAEQKAIAYGVMGVLTSLLSLLITIVLIYFWADWGGARIFALFMADFFMLAVRYRGRIHILIKPMWDMECIKQIIRYGLPSVIAVSGAWALNESDKLVVAHVAGMHAAGIYTAASGLAAVMMTFNQSLTNALYPEMYKQLNQGENSLRVLRKYFIQFLCLASVFSLLILAGYILLGGKILPAKYMGAKLIFITLVLSCIAVSCYRPFALVADYYKLARLRALSILIGGGCTICVGFFGVKYGGPVWAAIGIGCGYLIMIPIMLFGIIKQRSYLKNARI